MEVSLSLSLSIYLCIYLCIYLYLYIYLYLSLSIYLYLSIYLSIYVDLSLLSPLSSLLSPSFSLSLPLTCLPPCPFVFPFMKTAAQAKEKGNAFFKSGDFANAVTEYRAGLKKATAEEAQVLHKNLAACYLKLVCTRRKMTEELTPSWYPCPSIRTSPKRRRRNATWVSQIRSSCMSPTFTNFSV